MIVYFADRDLNILGHASTGLPRGLRIHNDNRVDEIEAGVVSFEFDLLFDDSERIEAEELTAVGNYLFRQVDGEAHVYTIIDSELYTRDGSVYVYAEDAGLDLLGEICEAYEAPSAQNIAFYVQKFAAGSGFTIGLNEVSTLTRKLAWTGESTATERLLSVANEFDAELNFSFEITGMSITAQRINIYKKRGKDIGTELRLGRDIDNITIKKSAANVATALKPTGGTPSGKKEPISLKGVTYDDKDFYIESSTGILKSRTALERWKRKLATGDGHIVKTYSYQTTDKTELRNRAISQLKKLREEEVNYEIDLVQLPENLACGDTVRVVDDQGELYLSARVLKLEDCESEDTHKATLGDYVMVSSGISEAMAALQKQVKELAENQTLYTWVAYADDASGTNISLDPTGKAYMGTAANRIDEEPDLSDPSVFTWIRTKGEQGETGPSGSSLTIKSTSITYQRGTSGTTKPTGSWGTSIPSVGAGEYLWTKTVVTYSDGTGTEAYSVSRNATNGTSPTVSGTTYVYAQTDSGTTPPSSGWQNNPPTAVEDKYMWTKVTVTYSDGATAVSYSVSKNGKNGTSVTIKSVTKSGDTTTIVLEDANGDKTLTIVDGEDGDDGTPGLNGYVHVAWANSADGKTDFSTSDSVGKTYLGTYTDNTAADSTDPTKYGWSLIKGAKGDTGVGISNITEYYALNNSTTAPADTAFSTGVKTPTATNRYLWNYELVTYTDTSTKKLDKHIAAVYGQTGGTGKGISSIDEYYALSTTATAPADTSFDTTIKTVTATNKYLWNYELVTYTDSTTYKSDKHIIGVYGDKGETGAQGPQGETGPQGTSVSVSKTEYQSGTSNTTAPTGTWSTSPVSVAEGSYLWTRVTYSDGKIAYSVAKQGKSGTNGTSPTVKSTVTEYQQSTSGTTVPTGTWATTPPTATAGQYMWTRVTVTYSDNATAISYSVAKNGTNGTSAYVYDLQVSPAAVVRAEGGSLSPTSITLTATRGQGTGTPTAYAGRFKIEYSTNGSTWTAGYTSSANESSKSYTLPTTTGITLVRCSLYLAGGTTTLLDTQTVPIVSDGATGKTGATGGTGPQGADAYTVILTNENHTFAGSISAAIAGSAECSVIAYKGATQVAATIGTITGQPTGMTTTIASNGTTSAKFTVSVTTAMVTKNGVLTVPVTVDGKSFSKRFTYSLALTGATGAKGETGTDVESITWYYQLATSKPAKPTTETPSGWSTSEPSYTAGSTSSLYICQKTTFSDGHFEYSDVSLSSSYEAAKVAYNKSVTAQGTAEAAQKAINNLEVGGDNLAFQNLPLNAPIAYNAYIIQLCENLVAGQTYTIQLWGVTFDNTPSGSDYVAIYWGGGASALVANKAPDANGYLVARFTPSKAQAARTPDARKWLLYVFNTTPSGSKTVRKMTLSKWKIEKGNVATPWSVSPAESKSGINLLRGTSTMTVGSGVAADGLWRASGGVVSNPASVATGAPFDVKGCIRVTNNGTAAARIGFAQDGLRDTFTVGETYTMSGWVRASANNLVVDFQSLWISDTQKIQDTGIGVTIGSNWTYFSTTGVLTGDQSDRYSAGYIYVNAVPANGWFEACGLKLEKGSAATGWSPAPEDSGKGAIEYINGTQTAATGAWTGVTSDKSLATGKTIAYKLPYAGSGDATLNLTLSDGTTTGAKAVYYNNTTRLSTQYGINSIVELIYDGSSWRVLNPYTNSNTIGYREGYVIAGANGIGRYTLIMKDSTGAWQSVIKSPFNSQATTHVKNDTGFYPYKILYCASGAEYASGKNTGDCYGSLYIDLRYSTNCGTTLMIGKPVYLVGTITDGLFYLADTWWTQTEPTTDDGKSYIYLGIAYNTSNIGFAEENGVYQYKNGKFQRDVITAEKIVAGAITADKIAANAITADKIKAGELTISKMATADQNTINNASSNASSALTKANSAASEASSAQSAAEAAQTTADAASTTATTANNRAVACRGVQSTAAGTAAKVVTCANFPTLVQGATVTVYNTTANTSAAAITLNVNSTGAKTIYVAGAATSASNQLLWAANSTITFTYDGTYWRVEDSPGTYYGTACAIAAGTAAKTTTVNEVVLLKGANVYIPMTYENTNTSATLNVTSLGAKNIYYGTSTTRPTTANGRGWQGGRTVLFTFDGASWRLGEIATIVDAGFIQTGTLKTITLEGPDSNTRWNLKTGEWQSYDTQGKAVEYYNGSSIATWTIYNKVNINKGVYEVTGAHNGKETKYVTFGVSASAEDDMSWVDGDFDPYAYAALQLRGDNINGHVYVWDDSADALKDKACTYTPISYMSPDWLILGGSEDVSYSGQSADETDTGDGAYNTNRNRLILHAGESVRPVDSIEFAEYCRWELSGGDYVRVFNDPMARFYKPVWPFMPGDELDWIAENDDFRMVCSGYLTDSKGSLWFTIPLPAPLSDYIDPRAIKITTCSMKARCAGSYAIGGAGSKGAISSYNQMVRPNPTGLSVRLQPKSGTFSGTNNYPVAVDVYSLSITFG